MTSALAVAALLAFTESAAAQRRNISGTWEIANRSEPARFDRVRKDELLRCDPADAQIGLLPILVAPAERLSIEYTAPTLVLGSGGVSSYSLSVDGQQRKLSLAGFEVDYRAQWAADSALTIELKLLGGIVNERYVRADGPVALRLEQTIAHPGLAQPVRHHFTYRAVPEANIPTVPPAAQATGQVADTTFRPAIEHPAYAAGTGPIVLIDEAHRNFHTATGRYLAFAEVLRRDGYVVKSSMQRFAPEVLRASQVLVMANAREPLTTDEVTAVRQWVNDGGALLLITDHSPFVEASMELGTAFGIRFRTDGARDLTPNGRLVFRRSDATLRDHAITRGIDQVVTFSGSSFEIDAGGIPLLVFGPQVCSDRLGPNPVPLEGHLQGAVLPFGAGRIAVFGEAAMFSAQVTGPNRSPMGMNAPVARQNLQLLLNVMRWLVAKSG